MISRSYGQFVPVSPKNCWRVKIEDSHRACGKWLFSQNGGLWPSFFFRKILGMICFFASMDSLFLFHLKTVKDKRYKIRRICLESQNGCCSFSISARQIFACFISSLLWTDCFCSTGKLLKNEYWRFAQGSPYIFLKSTRPVALGKVFLLGKFRNAVLSRSYGQFVPVSP